MNRLFDKKPKKSFKSSQRHISLGIPTNIAAGPLGFRAELDFDPKGEQSRSRHDLEVDGTDLSAILDEKGVGASQIIFRDGKSEDHGLAVTDVLATGSTVSSIEHGSDPTSEHFSSLLSQPMFMRISVSLPIRRRPRWHWKGKRRASGGIEGYVSIPVSFAFC